MRVGFWGNAASKKKHLPGAPPRVRGSQTGAADARPPAVGPGVAVVGSRAGLEKTDLGWRITRAPQTSLSPTGGGRAAPPRAAAAVGVAFDTPQWEGGSPTKTEEN